MNKKSKEINYGNGNKISINHVKRIYHMYSEAMFYHPCDGPDFKFMGTFDGLPILHGDWSGGTHRAYADSTVQWEDVRLVVRRPEDATEQDLIDVCRIMEIEDYANWIHTVRNVFLDIVNLRPISSQSWYELVRESEIAQIRQFALDKGYDIPVFLRDSVLGTTTEKPSDLGVAILTGDDAGFQNVREVYYDKNIRNVVK